MPINVPSWRDHQVLQAEVDDLAARVAALEVAIDTPPTEPPEPGGGTLEAIVHLNGVDYVYAEAEGEDLGDYHDPADRFIMSCVQAQSDCPIRVMFRRIEGWRCVIFELGHAFSAQTDLGPYSVTITDDGGEQHEIAVSQHFHLARWRWQSCPWPHPVSRDELFAAHLVPRFNAPLAHSGPNAIPPYEPMGYAGIVAYMPSTGGRPDIGFVTDCQGEALCTDTASAWANVMAQGEATGTFSWLWRDPETWAPLDGLLIYPRASSYLNGYEDPPLLSSSAAREQGQGCDTAHMPALAYLPFIRTGDPYYLEALQAQAMYCFTSSPRGNPQMPGENQIRAWAWSCRTVAEAYAVTPNDVPQWLLSKATWEEGIRQAVTFIEGVLADGSPLRALAMSELYINFRGNAPPSTSCGGFMSDYLIGAIAWAAVLAPAFAPWAAFVAHHGMARLGNQSGWPGGHPCAYDIVVRDTDTSPFYGSWGECWQQSAQYMGTTPDDQPTEIHFTASAQLDYPQYLYYGMAMMEQARALGVSLPDVGELRDKLNAALDQAVSDGLGGRYWRAAVA